MGNPQWRAALALFVAAIVPPLFAALPATAAEQPPGVVINEAYVNGGSANAAYKNKFVELYNSSSQAVNLDGWSIQYRPATGTGAATGIASLSGKSIAPHGYLLVQGGSNGPAGADLPAPDVTAPGFNPAATGGTIILARTTAALTLPTGNVTGNPNVADLVGYGTSNTFEAAPAAAPSGTGDPRSVSRTDGRDTDNNGADFALSASVSPQNSQSVDGPERAPDADIKVISEVQGTGPESPFVGKTVTTRGKVTAVYPTGGFDGYYIQTPGSGGTAAADRQSSDAIFVYSPSTVGRVHRGDYVEVTGRVSEYFKLTQIAVEASGLKILSEPSPEVKPTPFTLPLAEAVKEALEGMVVTPVGPYTVTDSFSLNNYGEVGLAAGTSPLVTPTAVAPYSDPVRVGSPATFTGDVVLDWRNNAWKFEPLEQLTPSNAVALEYSRYNDNVTNYYAPDPFRASDHDPFVVGLSLATRWPRAR